MACCTTEGTDRMFSKQADHYAKKFRKKGLDRPQRLIVEVLEQLGVAGRSILEIGCGVGGLHLSLLQKGGSFALGVEVSGGMIAKARELARELGFYERASYVQGDFVSTCNELSTTDIVVLDKVLCCYANPKVLIERSAAKANMLYAISYPRDAWIARLFFGSTERLGTLLRWSFHPFYHQPAEIEAIVREQGLEEVNSKVTPLWQVRVFRRREKAGSRFQ